METSLVESKRDNCAIPSTLPSSTREEVSKASEKSLLDLLPKGGNSMVDSLHNEVKYLRRILFLIQEAEEGIQHFLKGNLSHFDPHVGDTACQIRAYYFGVLWTKRDSLFPSLERDLSRLKTYAEKVMILIDQSGRNEHEYLRPCLLNVFLEELGLTLALSEQGLVLLMGHALSAYAWRDEEGISQKIDKVKLQNRHVGLGSSFLVEWIQGLQRRLAEISVNFIEELAVLKGRSSGNRNRSIALKEVEGFRLLPGGGGQGGGEAVNVNDTSSKSLILKDGLGRLQLPCLFVFNVILESLQHNSQVLMAWVIEFPSEPVLNRGEQGSVCFPSTLLSSSGEEGSADSISLFFSIGADSTWKFIDWSEVAEETPLFILRGFTHLGSPTAFIAQVKAFGPVNLVNYIAADHPQYGGVRDPAGFPGDYDRFYRRTLEGARSYKVGLGNPGELLLAFKHVLTCQAAEFSALSAGWPRLKLEKPGSLVAEI